MSSMSNQRVAEFDALARRTGFSVDAVESMWRSMVGGGGRMAQFDHADFGGPGQWMQGGLLMISDFSDAALKSRIAQMCDALAASIAREPGLSSRDGMQFQRQSAGDAAASGWKSSSAVWYPASLGTPDSSGTQNGVRYAWFGDAHRLAIDDGGTVTVYDTGDHRIGGVSQQQGASRTVAFVSQHGAVDVDRLPVVDGGQTTAPQVEPSDVDHAESATADRHDADDKAASDPFVALEKLAGLHRRGIVDDAEFAGKKAELLRRI